MSTESHDENCFLAMGGGGECACSLRHGEGKEVGTPSEASGGAGAPVELREHLAALCHEQWSGWMKYLFGKCEILPNAERGDLAVIPEWAVQRWKRQMNTPYRELSEREMNSDRAEADRFLTLLKAAKPPLSPLGAKGSDPYPIQDGDYVRKALPGESREAGQAPGAPAPLEASPVSPAPSVDLAKAAVEFAHRVNIAVSAWQHYETGDFNARQAMEYRHDLRVTMKELAESVEPFGIALRAALSSPPQSGGKEEGPSPSGREPAALVWSREKPKVDGFYWYRVPGQTKQSIDLVQMFTGSPCWHSAERHAWVPITWDLEWAGPIPDPVEPPAEPEEFPWEPHARALRDVMEREGIEVVCLGPRWEAKFHDLHDPEGKDPE